MCSRRFVTTIEIVDKTYLILKQLRTQEVFLTMTNPPTISILFLKAKEEGLPASFSSYLRSMPHIRISEISQLPDELSSHDIVITTNIRHSETTIDRLTQFARAGGGWHMFVNLSENPLPQLFGVQQEPAGPAAELRVLFENADHPLAARLPGAVYLKGRYHALCKTAEDIETILYADWQYSHKSVMTHRRVGEGNVACTTLQDSAQPAFQVESIAVRFGAIQRTR
jgi:hypothetical protein